MPRLAPIDEAFLVEAPLVVTASLALPHGPAQVWQLCDSGQLGTWLALLDRVRWHTGRPHGRGSVRSVRLGRLITIVEEFFAWTEERRLTFRVTEINLPIVRGWAEDLRLTPTPDGGTRLDYTIAIDNRLLRVLPVPHRLQRKLNAVATAMMAGITTVLPPVPAS